MLKEDLRIGNIVHDDWVLDSNKELVLDQTELIVRVLRRNCEKLSPIPLTPEWLERAGFDDDKRIDAFSIESNHKCYFIRKHCKIFWSLYQYNGFDDDTGEHISSIKYVHQLQNLYLALTGEELTIKEQVPVQ